MKRALAVLAAALLMAGCGAGRAEVSTISESDAYDRVESYVQRVAKVLPAGASLETATAPASVACKGQPRGRVLVTGTYWVRGLADDDKHFDTMLRWWQAHDFELLDDLRPERHYVWVQNKADGFRMSLRDNTKGELLLGAESPCLTADAD
jgi:hypothetical protein